MGTGRRESTKKAADASVSGLAMDDDVESRAIAHSVQE